jgi:hypothetical protein
MEDNNTNPITPQEFAKKIKSKYPQYKDIDDVTLTKKMIEKYPEYASQVSLKKKESSQPTSQESLWGSNSQPKDVYTSLVTDQQKHRQASVTSNGEQPKIRTLGVDITKEEALKPAAKKPTEKFETAKPYIKKTELKKQLSDTKVTAKNQDEVNIKIEEVSKLDQQTKQIEKERFDRIEQDFVSSKDEASAEVEAEKRLQDLLSNTGVWNKTKTFAKNAYNTIIDGVSGANPLTAGLANLAIDTDPLADEKKLVRKQAAKDNVKLSEQEVFEQAKKVYKDKQIENIETDRINSFLDDLPEEDRLALKQDRLNTAIHLKEENLKNEKAINAYAAIGKQKIEEYKDIENQLKSLKEKGIAFPQDLYDRYTSLFSDIQNISKNIQKRQDSFLKNKSDLGTVEQEFDLLKRQYGDVENFLLNTGIAARELGVGILGGLDFIGGKINPTANLSSMQLQGKLIDINKGLAEERDNLRKSVESVESAEGLLNYASDVLSNQLPNLVATSTGAGGLALMGVSGVGQKYAEMNQEVLEGKASYTPLQMAVAPLLYGGAEVISEIPTLSILKKGGRVLDAIAKNQADLLTKTAVQKGKEFAKDFAGDQLKEGAGEQFTNFAQNVNDRFILGKKDVGLLDNTGTVLKDTFTLTSMLKIAPHLAGLALKPFQSKVDLGLLDENARKIIEFSRSLNTLDLSEDEKSVLKNQIQKATEENSKIMANTIDNVANMPNSVYLKVNEINKKAAQLKDDARVINDGNLPNKAALLKDLENQYRGLQTERSSLINTKYSPYAQLESLPSEELVDLKNEAQRELMNELNPDGTKSITITDDQISKKALELYKSKQEQKTQEATPVETTELKTTVEEVTPVELKEEAVTEETATPTTEVTPQAYVEELAKTKESDPEAYWSVSEVSPEDAAKGTIIDTPDGSALVKPDGDIAGLFKKLTSKAKGVAQDLLNKAVAAGGIKLDNFDGYLTKQYEKAGFRIVSRVPFSLEYGVPDGYNKEKHGTPDVVAMVYDPNNELDIEEKTFEDYDEAMAYRDGFVNQARNLTTQVNTVQEVIDESEKSNNLPSLVQKAKTALSKILPGTGIILYNTEAEYKAAINEGADENSGGAFVGGKIHINPNRANGRTVAHEVFHAVLLNMVKSDPAAQRVTAAMMTAIEKVLPPDMKAKLQDFVESGYDAQKELWDEEKLAELVGYLAENFSSLSQPAKNIIKEWLDQLAKLVGIKEFTDKEVIDFMNTLSGKVASGEVITEGDVSLFNEEGSGGFVGIFKIPRQQNSIEAPKAKDDPRSFVRDFVKDIDIRDFNGEKFITNMYDYTNAGKTDLGNGYDINLFGGKGYVPYMMELNGKKIGDVSNLAAFNTNAQAETFIRNAEKSGAKLFAPHSGTKSQSWQFQQHTFAELVDLVLDKNILTNKELIDTFNNSIKGNEALKDKFSKFSNKYGQKINDFNTFESDPKKIVELLDINNNLSPDLRKALNNSIASNKKFQEAIGIKNKEEFYNRIMDPLNNGITGGEIMGVVDFDPSTFEIVKTKPNDIDHHPSFGYTLLAKINGIYQPTEFYKSYDITDSYTKYNINGENISIKSEDIDFDKKNVTSSAGAIPKVAEFNVPKRKQIIGEKAVKDKLVQNNLDTAKEMEAANKSAEDIFIATGWEKGADNKWKYDLQEGVVEFKNKKNGKASEVINYPELFKAYPKAKNIDIVFMNSDKFDGMYLPSKNRIMLSNSLSDSELKSTLLHEVQHFIQNEEGFAVGGTAQTIKDLYNARIKYEKNFSVKKVLNNIKNSLFKPNPESVKEDLNKLSKLVSKSDEELYKSIAGEVEAFNVEKRAKMTPEERKVSPISKTAEKPKEEQVVISESDAMLKDRKQTNRPSVNKIYEQSEKAIKDRNKKKSIKDLGPYLRKSLLDRQAYIKRLLDRIENKSAKKAYDLLVTKAGASALAAERFKQAEKEIYGKLNSEDTKTLDKIIYARRIVAVNESRAELGMPPYKGMDGYSLEDAKQDLADFKQELGDKKFNDLNDRATTYFNVFKANLRKLYDSGRISKEVYESLRNTEYSPIKTIKYIIGDNLSPDEIDTQAKSLGISRNDIMKLSDANENEIILDSKWLLAMNIGSVEGRAFENRMLIEFNKAIESATADEKKAFEEFVLDNPVVGKKKDGGPKYKYDDTKIPVGYSKVSYFENGNKREIVLKDIYAKQLLDVKNKNTFLENIGKLTGTQILRFFATGGNPLFIIGNTAVDFQNIAFWSDTYSKFKPLAAVQLMRDFTKNFVKKAVVNNKYNAIFNEYINHGGALDYLSNDGLKALESMNPVKTVTKQVQKGLLAYGRAMAFLGETSEVAFRLSVFEKVKEDSIKEFKKENGREPNFQEKEDILWKAAREARETMDFSQGGDVAKNIDAVFPYFNAALQGVRRPIDFAMNNPVGFASSVLQYTAMAGSLTAASLAMLIKSVRDDEEDDDKANKKILEALNSISEYEKANYHVLFTGNKNKDGEYEYYRIKKLPVLSVISTVGDQLIYNDFFKNVGIDYKIDKEAIQEAAIKSNPLPITVQELAGKNPVASGLVSYWANKDTFTGEKIFREPNNKKILPEAEGIFDDKVDQVYKDLAPGLGLSPARTKVMVEKVITSENTNPTIPLIYSAYDGMFNKKDGLGNEASEAMSNVGKAFGKKLVRYTDKNIIRYKKQDEMEYKESVTETDIWKKEQKVYNEIKGAYKDGGSLTEKEFVDVIKKNFDPIDQPKYAKKYFAYINNMNVDKSVLDIIFEDVPEVQAMKLNQRYGSNLEETEIKELEEAMRSSRRKVNKKALYIYNEKYKNRKPAN